MTVALHCNWRLWIGGGNKSKIYWRRKGIFHKHWHTHQLPGGLTRLGPLWSVNCAVSCPESGLRIAWPQPPPAMPVWPVCQQWQHRHTLTVEKLAKRTLRGPAWDWCKLSPKQTYMLSDIQYLHLKFSALTHLTTLTLVVVMCLHTHLYMHACKHFEICAHTDIF